MTQKIYFDESGFTGNNLLNPDQMFFAYASVASTDNEAEDFVSYLIEKYRIQSGELKGSKLIRFNNGRKAVDEIFCSFEGRLKVSIYNKKFALACKFFEYIFEPCISDIKPLFYGNGFHRFIANYLYAEFQARGAGAEQILSEFEKLMKTRDDANLHRIFSSSINSENSPIITLIREFTQYRAKDILKELSLLDDVGVGKWVLDLTGTSLFNMLADWGTEFTELTAICDHSKPLQHTNSIFDTMIGLKKQVFNNAFGKKHPISFNLSGPIQFMDSKITHGIQIADAVAAASIYAFSVADDNHANKWRSILADINISQNDWVMPDPSELNLNDSRVQRNSVLLIELHSRAKNGTSLIEGMADYLHIVNERLIPDPIMQNDSF